MDTIDILESKIEDSCTKSNEHEATFLARFARYLVQQGYTMEQITVLTGMCIGGIDLESIQWPSSVIEEGISWVGSIRN